MTESEFTPTPAHAKAESTSLGDLLGEVTQDLSTLIRQEVELAKVELKQSATRAGRGAGMFAGAGVAGHFVLLFLSLALWYALGELIGLGWSAVVVAVLWAIVAAVLASKGRSDLKAVKGMPQTAETIQEIPQTLKPREEQR
ncbi:phage holin family protein [Arthrobacter alkaliphilus]|uniref:phage holin family protein n=1 Tax=Arthrobacter alkaliphilus TaxID=369936 RepID=UPI001F39A441|nr:phage holin family protein [Arthrobacter alkaliphilus]